MSPFDINSVVFHFNDFNYGRRSQQYFFSTITTQLFFFINYYIILTSIYLHAIYVLTLLQVRHYHYWPKLSVYDVYILWNPSYPSALDRWIRDMAKKNDRQNTSDGKMQKILIEKTTNTNEGTVQHLDRQDTSNTHIHDANLVQTLQ